MDFPQAGPGVSGESRPLAEASGCRADYGGVNSPSACSSDEEHDIGTKRKKGGLDLTLLDVAGASEVQKPKKALNTTLTKRARETLNVIEAKVGAQLAWKTSKKSLASP